MLCSPRRQLRGSLSNPTNGGEQGAAPQPQMQEVAPRMSVLAQYLKDFSFDNPKAQALLAALAGPAGASNQITSRVSRCRTRVRVALKIEGKGDAGRHERLPSTRVRWRVSSAERAKQNFQSADLIEWPAAVISLRARNHRGVGGAQRGVPPAADRPGRVSSDFTQKMAESRGSPRRRGLAFLILWCASARLLPKYSCQTDASPKLAMKARCA